jgi:DNA invertase Pin-like site-specific DNA recombinase
MNPKLTAERLARTAIVYVRQSTAGQVKDHPESRRRQYALVETARELGFHNVEMIDDDLGVSGAGFCERPGFRRLLTAVAAGQVGAVLALEASRLARNDRDWSHLMEIGAIANVILVDHDGIYDPRTINDRLLLGLKGIMSEFELATLRQRAYEAVRAKARRGELRLPLPVGFVRGPSGKVELDPDRRVQQAVGLVFRKYEELGSIRQVLLWYRREGIKLPTVHHRKGVAGEVEWIEAVYHRVYGMIENPAYAGAYAFGRSESRTTIEGGRVSRTTGHAKAMESWEVLIRDHHPGYIDWTAYVRNKTNLEENAFMKPTTGRKSGRGGRSVLTGLVRCRRCGHMMEVNYRGSESTTPAFRCRRRHQMSGGEFCTSFSGTRVEQVVGLQILAAVEGRAIEASIEAARRIDDERRERRKAFDLELEHARYEAQLAARRYNQVDPDKRLVAAELEARWNDALEHVRDIEAKLESFDTQVSERQPLDAGVLRALAADLQAVWNDATTDMRLKQRIARILLREIIADIDEQAQEIVLTLHWQGGRHTEVRVARGMGGRTRRCTQEEAIELARRMAGRWSDHAIASALNKMGSRTGAGNHWNRLRVRALRSRMGFPALGGEPVTAPLLTAKLAAQKLGLSAAYVGLLCARGVIPGTRVAPNSPWWIDPNAIESEEVRQALRALRDRRAVNRTYTNQNLTIPGL